jgi:hypothetical protein
MRTCGVETRGVTAKKYPWKKVLFGPFYQGDCKEYILVQEFYFRYRYVKMKFSYREKRRLQCDILSPSGSMFMSAGYTLQEHKSWYVQILGTKCQM